MPGDKNLSRELIEAHTVLRQLLRRERKQGFAAHELFRLLGDSHPGDILLIEQLDRLSRLGAEDWTKLRTELQARQVRVVALDLPTSWIMTQTGDEFTGRMFDA